MQLGRRGGRLAAWPESAWPESLPGPPGIAFGATDRRARICKAGQAESVRTGLQFNIRLEDSNVHYNRVLKRLAFFG